MRHLTFLAILLAASCVAQSQAPEAAPFLTAIENMPSQIRARTFDHEAFNASLALAITDANLDLAAVCHLLEADLADSNPQVNTLAAVSLSNLMRRKSNTEGDRQLLASIFLSCIDKSKDPNLQQVCVTFGTDYGMPMSAIAKFKDIAAKKIADGTAYPALAVGLGLVAAKGLNMNAGGVLADFFSSTKVSDTAKTKALFSIQNLTLSDQVLDAVAELLSKTKNDELKVQIIQASQKFGRRALEREHNTLLALEANLSESENVRGAAGNALRATPQSDAATPAIH